MDITPIKTKADYKVALVEIEDLMNAELDTPEGDRLDVLGETPELDRPIYSQAIGSPWVLSLADQV